MCFDVRWLVSDVMATASWHGCQVPELMRERDSMICRVFVPDEPTQVFHDRGEAEEIVRMIEARGFRLYATPVTGRDDQVVAVEYRFHRLESDRRFQRRNICQ